MKQDYLGNRRAYAFIMFALIDIILFLLLIYLPISEELKVWIYVGVLIGSLIYDYSLIYGYSIKYRIDYQRYLPLMEDAVIELKRSKMFVYSLPPLVIVFLILYYVKNISPLNNIPLLGNMPLELFSIDFETLILFIMTWYIQMAFSMTVPQLVVKEFYYYLAKYYFELIGYVTICNKVKYLTLGLSAYNRYLNIVTELQIRDIKKVCSKIITDSSSDINEQVKKLLGSFGDDSNKLKPVKAISIMLDKNAAEFLVNVPTSQKIKENITFLIPLLSLGITVIGIVLTPK